MPKREDEYWAGMKEPKGRGLCPFCGRPDIYPSKRHRGWWECANEGCHMYRRPFPSPSYGSGGDFGKEARWFGKATEEIRRREFAEVARKARTKERKESSSGRAWFGNEYYDPKSKKWKRPKGGLLVRKIFLVLLVIACLVAAVWTGYLLFTRQTDPVVGTIILLADIGVLVWNISVLRRYRVGAGTIFSIFLIVALLGATVGAFAGVEPLSNAKDKIVDFFESSGISGEVVSVERIDVSASVLSLERLGWVRRVTVYLKTPQHSETVARRVELRYGNYYYGHEIVVFHPDESEQKVAFILPASEPVFQEGGEFNVDIIRDPELDKLFK